MSNQNQTQDPAIIKLPNVRLSFPHLFKAHAMVEGTEPKFGATFLLDNDTHGPLLDHIEKVINDLAREKWGKLPKMPHFKSCLRDGNEKSEMEGYGDGVSFISASRKTRPAVVNRDRSPITEEDGLMIPGYRVNASIRLWIQDNQWGKRCNAELRAVQFVAEDETFGAGTVNVENEFEALPAENAYQSLQETTGSHRSQRSTKPAAASTSGDDY